MKHKRKLNRRQL